jgi:hypothetical protein
MRNHFFVREADDPETKGFEVGRPLSIVLLPVVMPRTVYFDHETSARAVEVDDESADSVLEAKLDSESFASQGSPETRLCGRRLVT